MITLTPAPTYTIDFKNLTFKDGEYVKSSDWCDKIEDGGFSRDCWMSFEYMGIEISVNFDLTVCGRETYDPGDYYTAPYYDCEITEVSVDINEVFIDEYEVELTKDIKDILLELVNKNL